MARLGLLGWLIVTLMVILAGVVIGAIAFAHFERTAAPIPYATPYPRLEQAVGAIELMRDADPNLEPVILRALNGTHLRATIVDTEPPASQRLHRAPRIEATLRAFSDGRAEEDLHAYTDTSTRQPSDPGTEGRPARIVWKMPSGRFLVLEDIEAQPGLVLRLFGLPPGFWIGLLGICLAALALYASRRETQPLRRLASAAAAFNGRAPSSPIDAQGTPDVQDLARAVHDMQMRVAGLLHERAFLIGAISHDLKTYLTRLRLRAESVPETDGRARMVGDVDGMNDLIDTSLAFARGTTVSGDRDRVDLADLAAIEAAERDALGQMVEVCGTERTDAVVAGDVVALRRVVANLVSNATKFGKGRVVIAVEVASDACRLTVDDDGPGIGAAERTAIFSPFYRIEGSRSRGTGGSGLGLAVARQIVEAHGGTLAVSDGPLGGARFIVTLPRADPK